MLVQDVLKIKGRRLITIGPDATVKDAIAQFVEHNIGSLPVVDSQGRLVGIFSERDVLYTVHENAATFQERRIQDEMTEGPITCNLMDPVHEVMGKISQHRVGQLPVIEDEKLVGVVSVGDLIKSMFERVENENKHLLSYLYGPA